MAIALLASAWMLIGCSTLPILFGVDPDHLHFEKTTLVEGIPAPDFTLSQHDGQGEVTLSELRGKPVVLIFGSYTWGPFRGQFDRLKQMCADHSGRAHFLMVYIREAHASDEWAMGGIEIAQPKTDQQRAEAAQQFAKDFLPNFPVVVDRIDDRVNKHYGGWPDRIYVINADGLIVYQGKRGPFGFRPSKAEKVLNELLVDG